MGFRSNVRAEISSNVISYLIATAAMVIIGLWLFKSSGQLLLHPLDNMDEDLLHIKELAGHACTVEEFQATYDPLMKEGLVVVNESTICIEIDYKDIARCVEQPCQLEPLRAEIHDSAPITLTFVVN